MTATTTANPIKETTLISRKQFEAVLLDRFGLTIDKDCIHKYMDSYGCNRDFYNVENPLVFTCSYNDRFGFGWANVNGEFYQKHTTQKTELFNEFKQFIETHTFKIGKHFLI